MEYVEVVVEWAVLGMDQERAHDTILGMRLDMVVGLRRSHSHEITPSHFHSACTLYLTPIAEGCFGL